MLKIDCKGTPYQIGYQHGQAAKTQIDRCIAFYGGVFRKFSKLEWPQVLETARDFDRQILEKWPKYYEEMKGIADGSHRDILDIVAINVRTEIAFGLFSDGCTSLYWKTEKRALLGQNWDWMETQKENLILITIHQDKKPAIKMITEAGMIGKIGFNSSGVGVCFNAIRAKGLDMSRVPAHLALRMVLESTSAKEAVEELEKIGVASSAHLLIADASEAVGLEVTSTTMARISMDSGRRVIHSNHLLEQHPGVNEPKWLPDSETRVDRMHLLTEQYRAKSQDPSWQEFSLLFEDQDNFPTAICRAQEGASTTATLFNIVMDLNERRAAVRLGRPCAVEETDELSFR